MTKKKWIIIGVVAVLLVGGYFGWKAWAGKKDPAEDMATEAPPMPTAKADVGEVKKTVYATGVIEAKEHEDVKSDSSAKVAKLLVKEGQHVSKGDVLFTYDSTDTQLDYQKQVLSVDKIKKEMLDLKEEKAQIISDQKGVVKEVSVKVGDELSKNTVIAKVADIDHLKITGRFSAAQRDKFHVGQKVKVFLQASLSYIEGTVTKLDQVGKKEKDAGVLYDVDVIVNKASGLGVGDYGSVQYVSPSGEITMSQVVTAFTLPDVVEITAGTTGKVGRVAFNQDDQIQKGQLLIEMDREAAELERKEKEIAVKEAERGLEQRRKDIAKMQVTASVSGIVTKVNVKEGESVDNSKPAVVIIDMSEVYMKASVDEVDIPLVQIGQPVEVYVTAFGNQVFHGKVVDIPQESVTQDKNVRFEVKIAIQDGQKMKHGMSGDCDIIVSNIQNAVRLPIDAVEIMEDGKGTVMVKDANGQPTPKEVETGVEGLEFVEIKNGLKAGDEVILGGGGGMMP